MRIRVPMRIHVVPYARTCPRVRARGWIESTVRPCPPSGRCSLTIGGVRRATRSMLTPKSLGKLAVALAPPEPQLQHAALRLTARGWETAPLPAPDGSGALVVALDLRTHEALAEHSGGAARRVALTPDRPVGEVTRELLDAVGALAGAVKIDPTPQEVPWTVPLDEDEEHARYDPAQVASYFAAATRAALVLAAFRAPYRGRSTPVNAWWGSFDLAVNLFSGLPADPPSEDFIMRNAMDAQEVAIGWWPGDPRYARAAFYAYAHPAPEGFRVRDALTRRRALGGDARRVRPRLGRCPFSPRPARAGTRIRPLGVQPRVCGVRLGSGARGQRRRDTTTRRVRRERRSLLSATRSGLRPGGPASAGHVAVIWSGLRPGGPACAGHVAVIWSGLRPRGHTTCAGRSGVRAQCIRSGLRPGGPTCAGHVAMI